MYSGSSIGTLYFGSPAELQYVSAFIKTEILRTHKLTCYQTGCHLLIHSPSVDTTHFVAITEADRLLLKREQIHICVTDAWTLQQCLFLGWWSTFPWNMLLPSSWYELHPGSNRSIVWQLYEHQTYPGQIAELLLMKQVVSIVTTTFRVNAISMTISHVQYSGQWRRLCWPTHLQACRPFWQVVQKYHVLSLETFHIPATSYVLIVFSCNATQPAALRAPLNKWAHN
jgi:hypothetical protein